MCYQIGFLFCGRHVFNSKYAGVRNYSLFFSSFISSLDDKNPLRWTVLFADRCSAKNINSYTFKELQKQNHEYC